MLFSDLCRYFPCCLPERARSLLSYLTWAWLYVHTFVGALQVLCGWCVLHHQQCISKYLFPPSMILQLYLPVSECLITARTVFLQKDRSVRVIAPLLYQHNPTAVQVRTC